jgi:hypothetical protein
MGRRHTQDERADTVEIHADPGGSESCPEGLVAPQCSAARVSEPRKMSDSSGPENQTTRLGRLFEA